MHKVRMVKVTAGSIEQYIFSTVTSMVRICGSIHCIS